MRLKNFPQATDNFLTQKAYYGEENRMKFNSLSSCQQKKKTTKPS